MGWLPKTKRRPWRNTYASTFAGERSNSIKAQALILCLSPHIPVMNAEKKS